MHILGRVYALAVSRSRSGCGEVFTEHIELLFARRLLECAEVLTQGIGYRRAVWRVLGAPAGTN
jgi:hypothetical protein